MVSQLSDQLDDLSSKLEYLEEDQRSSLGARERLRREKEALQERMEECDERIRSTEQLSQRILQENEDRHAVSINRLRRESQAQLDDLSSQLQTRKEEIERYHSTEANIRAQLATTNEVVVEYEGQIRGWQKACEEAGREKKRRSLTVSDMGSEVSRLRKEIEKLKRDNEGLQARFLQHGKELLSQNTQSLADEMEDASKDDVMKVLREAEVHNARLHEYIEGLLVSIIDKHPELLEKR
jgi:chromosome segregation ATPase